MNAPMIKKNGFLDEVSKKLKQIPGNTACAMASPINDFFRMKLNVPIMAELAAKSSEPITTYTIVAS